MEFDFKEIATITMILFAVIDVIGSLPVLLDLKSKHGKIQAEKATLVSGVIMIVFMFIGQQILSLIGIDVSSFAIAGSFIIFFLALEMILGIKFYKEETASTASVVPIAFPLIAGTGTLTTLLSIRAEYKMENIIVAILVNLIFVYIVLRNTYRLEKILGLGGINILRKVFGVILLAIAVKLLQDSRGNLKVMAKKQKFYVVWNGRQIGVYDNWDKCNAQVFGFEGAKYKSFETRKQAEDAFRGESHNYIGKNVAIKPGISEEKKKLIGSPVLDSISVDGAWNTNTGIIEYQGVYTKTVENIFRQGPYEDGTNNIAEFLAIVHALAYCKKNNLTLPIYSDSKIAISWVKIKLAKTNHKQSNKNKNLFELIQRAEKWLHENDYPNKILKWETKAWGENPADFGRK